AAHGADRAGQPVHDVARLAGRDRRREVLRLAVVLDRRVLLAREVDGGVLAGDEELVARLVRAATLRVVGDDLGVEALDLVELDGAELLRRTSAVVARLDEALGRQREDDLRADLVALLAVLVDEDRVLEALERERL